MKFIKLTLVLLLFILTACTSTKKNNSTDFKLSDILVTNATVQEMVSGVEGGHNTLKFAMNIEFPSDDLVADSLFFGNLKMKLILKNKADKKYVASVVNRLNLTISDSKMSVNIKYKGINPVVVSVEYKVLESIYMP